MIFQANSQVKLKKPGKLQPNDNIFSIPLLFQILPGCLPPNSKQQLDKNNRMEALKDLTRLLELITKQKKKYEGRLSPYSNFYRRYLMVQQFIQTQLKTTLS